MVNLNTTLCFIVKDETKLILVVWLEVNVHKRLRQIIPVDLSSKQQ